MAAQLAAGSALGWHSETLTNHLRAVAARDTKYEIRDTSEEGECPPAPLRPCPPAQPTNDERQTTIEAAGSPPAPLPPCAPASLIRVYPDLALAMLRHKAAAAGRVWLLLRGLDAAGTGRLPVADAARWLTDDGSPAHLCGRRQFANLLAAGDGLYWQRDRGRDGAEQLRLASAGRVAAALGVRRLGVRPVGVPLQALTGTIGQARAQLYATFHSGRTQTDLLTGRRRARGPIARETLCKLSGASRNSQRAYERRAGVARRAGFALGPPMGAADEHEAAWRRGRALFHYRDAAGRYGRPGAVYLAWQLPNEYTGPHDTLSRGRQKRLNRALADLFLNGMTGNGERATSDELRVTSQESAGGQWGRGSVGQCSADLRYEIRNTSEENAPNSYLPRCFYNSAKAAHLARHDGEKYWRLGQMWITTNDEYGTRRANGSSFVIPNS